jgi:uncharacterized protein (TIGR03663 family)
MPSADDDTPADADGSDAESPGPDADGRPPDPDASAESVTPHAEGTASDAHGGTASATAEAETTDSDSPNDGEPSVLERAFRADRIVWIVVGVAVLALAVRFFALGERIAHWDEGRVAWWTLNYMETGTYRYRSIIHGPFINYVNTYLFGLFGASDFSMRLFVAALTGLIPLTALGLRERLADSEVVAFSLFLAFNPLFLYYSRFMRGDPLVLSFMLIAFVLFVRLLDTGRRRYLWVGAVFLALAFASKENAILYLVTWVGGTVVLLDHVLFRASDEGRDWTRVLGGRIRTVIGRAWAWFPALILAGVAFLVVIVFFYAPRSGDPNQLGLYNAVSQPGMFPDVVGNATVGSWEEFYGNWVDGGHQDHAYLPYLGHYLKSMGFGAPAICLLAVVGLVADRYSTNGPRDLVTFAFFWGVAAVAGYPIVTDIKAPWAATHAVIPLAIPAAVGLALVYRWTRTALLEDDPIGVGVGVVFLLVVAGLVASMAVWQVYLIPQADGNNLVQYAQPGDDISPALERMAVASEHNQQGPDLVMYGDFYVDGAEPGSERLNWAPMCSKWFNALPMPWYFGVHDTNVSCAQTESELREYGDAPPPIVMTRRSNGDTIRGTFPTYWNATYELRTYGTHTSFFIHPEYANESSLAAMRTRAAD